MDNLAHVSNFGSHNMYEAKEKGEGKLTSFVFIVWCIFPQAVSKVTLSLLIKFQLLIPVFPKYLFGAYLVGDIFSALRHEKLPLLKQTELSGGKDWREVGVESGFG